MRNQQALKMFKPFIWLILFLLLASGLVAQTEKKYAFQHLSVKDGLSNSSVYALLQDNDGYLWFGTADGLNKYDGDKITVYKHEPFNKNSLPDNWITALTVDNSGYIWVGTYGGGLSMLNPYKEEFTNFSSNSTRKLHINSETIRTLHFNKKNNFLWIGTEVGLNLYDTKNNRFKILNIEKSKAKTILTQKSINAIYQINNDVYTGTWGDGLISFNLKTGKTWQHTFRENTPFPEKYNRIKSLLEAPNGNLWVASRGSGIFLFNPRTKKELKNLNFKDGNLSNDKIYSLISYQNKQLWAGTYYNGLNLIEPTSGKHLSFMTNPYDLNAISGNWIPGLLIDRTHILWIGTDKGVSKLALNGVGFNYYTIRRSNLNLNFEANINAIFEDRNKNIWLGTWGQGLIKFNRKTKQYTQYLPNSNPASISSPRVWNIQQDKYGRLWVGTGRALDVFDTLTQKFRHYYSRTNENNLGILPANNISSLLIQGDSVVWVGTWGGGLSAINIASEKVLKFDNTNIHGTRIKSIFVDKKGRLWLGSSNNGVSLFNPKTKKWRYFAYHAGDNNSLSGDNIECFAEDSDFIWIATNKSGLNRIDKRTFRIKHILEKNGLASNSIRRIIIDSLDNLWLSSQNGIIKYNHKTEEFRNFDQTDGLQSNEFTRGYAYLSSGEIAFGGNNGFNIFNPQKLNINKVIPKIVISHFYKYNKKFNLHKTLDKQGRLILQTSENMISFEFRALDFNAPRKNKYLYKLEGFDKEWRKPLDKPIATYTNLPAGKFVFRVIASNNHGFWNTDGISLKIRVYPPIYLTWQFYISLLLVLITFSLAYIKYREFNLKNAALRLERLVEEKTSEVKEKNKLLELQKADILEQKQEIEIQKHEVEAQRDAMQLHRDLIQEQKQQLTDSILYAQTIQMAMMPDSKALHKVLPKSFLLFRPKDIVSGDFVWIKKINNLRFIAVADCTGHGVPGAFMSMFGISILNELVLHEQLTKSADLLEGMRNRLTQSMSYKSGKYAAKDGIDIGLCIWDISTDKLQFAGAHIPLYLIRDNELIEYPGDKISVGHFIKYQSFKNTEISLRNKDKIYLFTDGFADQFGGKNEHKFMKKNLKKLILENHKAEMVEQEVVFTNRIKNWMGIHEQIDDITGLGFEINSHF